MVIMHPHPIPLPSRERENWIELMSIFWFLYFLTSCLSGVIIESLRFIFEANGGDQFETNYSKKNS